MAKPVMTSTNAITKMVAVLRPVPTPWAHLPAHVMLAIPSTPMAKPVMTSTNAMTKMAVLRPVPTLWVHLAARVTMAILNAVGSLTKTAAALRPANAGYACDAGYTLNADGKACDDINECADQNGGCAQTCTNADGTYTCSCDAGYTINANVPAMT